MSSPEPEVMNLRVKTYVHEELKVYLVKKGTPEKRLQELTENLIHDGMKFRKLLGEMK